ncbi:hypothetical protein IFM89_035160 [Coptis chinensis]|uniref:Homeobox domain-containing protein n=1 Tax=Coptis chinensis TaxID=261450 RepID=A0A835MAY2_9MAGN|nr:hypothetical protein IFM89_035160 [Coptis chinensis]
MTSPEKSCLGTRSRVYFHIQLDSSQLDTSAVGIELQLHAMSRCPEEFGSTTSGREPFGFVLMPGRSGSVSLSLVWAIEVYCFVPKTHTNNHSLLTRVAWFSGAFLNVADQPYHQERLFKESPHPDEKQRQQLSKKLGLAPRQVKFWFQNRRTQIKAVQERHENSLLKTELEKLQEENRAMREVIKNACCPNCGLLATSSRDVIMTTEEQQLRIENARLKAEVEKLRTASGRYPTRTMSPSSSCSAGNDQENRNSLDDYDGILGLERSKISEIADQAMEELTKMATVGEPL